MRSNEPAVTTGKYKVTLSQVLIYSHPFTLLPKTLESWDEFTDKRPCPTVKQKREECNKPQKQALNFSDSQTQQCLGH